MKKKFLPFVSEKGQSLVELAISLLILLYLLSGAAEFGIALFQYVQLRDAAQEGALYGSIQPTSFANIEARARASSGSPINLAVTGANGTKVQIYINDVLVWVDGVDQGVNVTNTACEGVTGGNSNGVKVVVSYDHRIFMAFMPQILRTDHIHLSADVTDTILTPPCP